MREAQEDEMGLRPGLLHAPKENRGVIALIDLLDGSQVRLGPNEVIRYVGPGRRIGSGHILVSQVPDAMADPDGWIEFRTRVRWEPEEEWREPDEWQPAVRRIYARGVASVMVTEDRAG